MTPTAITMAATMTGIWRAMPTAVITESSENTMSSSRIWKMSEGEGAAAAALALRAVRVVGLQLVVDLPGRLGHQEERRRPAG